MRPLQLRATNFRTYPTLDLAFHGGLVGILGELRDAPEGADSNGSGKSSILEAIDICLFGRRSLSGFLTRGGDVTELMLELTFEHAGSVYKVRRTFSARTKAGKTTCDFEQQGQHSQVGEVWTPLTRSSTKETDQLLVETIGLTRDTFRNSSYLRQGDGSYADPARDPKQRKDLLVEAALGRDPVWPRLQEAARTAKRTATSELERIAGETRAARELVDTKTDAEEQQRQAVDVETNAIAHLAETEAVLQATSERYLAAKDGAARRQTCEAEISAARATLEQLQRVDVAATEAILAIGVARDELETLPTVSGTDTLVARERELVAAIADHERAQAAHREREAATATARRERDRCEAARGEARTTAGALNERAAALRAQAAQKRADEAATCQTCGQHVTEVAKERAVAELEQLAGECEAKALACDVEATRLAELVAEGDALLATAAADPTEPEGEPPTADLATVRAQLAAAQQQVQQRARLEERITGLQRDVDARPAPVILAAAGTAVRDKQAELGDIEPVNLASIEAAGVQARASVASARTHLDTAKTVRVRLDERLAQIQKAGEALAIAAFLEEELQADIDVETIVEKACGRDGIPALILENRVIPFLETEASAMLQKLGKPYQVELRTQEVLKSGDGLKDGLWTTLITETGEAPFEDFSEGEKSRIGIALKIALAALMANGRGAESKVLMVDEPMFLDKSGMEALLSVLNDLLARGVFAQIVVVSHFAELRDSIEDTILVINESGRSRVQGDSTGSPHVAADVEIAA